LFNQFESKFLKIKK